MHDGLLLPFREFSEGFEGRCRHLYLDDRGFPTTGIGCIVNKRELVLALPWRLPDGTRASDDVVVAQWNDLRAQLRLAVLGAKAAERVTTIRLTDADVDALFARRVAAIEAHVSQAFSGWARLPADAQMAVLSLAFGMGSAFTSGFPKFTAAINAGDFATARAECAMVEVYNGRTNQSIVRRNSANRLLLSNAQIVADDAARAGRARGTHLYTFTRLYWPQALASGASA